MTDDNHETLARSLFSSEGKKPAQRRRASKSPEPMPTVSSVPIGDPGPHSHPAPDIAKLQATAQAWEDKYQQVQTELETLRPQLITLQAQIDQQTKLIQEQQAAISFWQQKAQVQSPVPAQPLPSPPAPPTLPTRPQQVLKPPLKPLAVPPTASQPHAADPLPDFMLD